MATAGKNETGFSQMMMEPLNQLPYKPLFQFFHSLRSFHLLQY